MKPGSQPWIELSKVLDSSTVTRGKRAELVRWLSLLFPHYDPGPGRDVTRAKAEATRALKKFLSCGDRHPEIQHALSPWQSARDCVELLIQQLNQKPFEITVKDVIDGKPVEPKAKKKPGRPKADERRAVVGGIVAFAFQLARVPATRGRRGEFGRACIAVCIDIGIDTVKEFDQVTLDDFLRRGRRHWEDVLTREVRARCEQQLDEALEDITVTGERVGKKSTPL